MSALARLAAPAFAAGDLPEGMGSGVLSVAVVSDPGHGFGAAAQLCARQKRFLPALDRAGTPIVASVVVNVRFMR
jgi:hypothetical protein